MSLDRLALTLPRRYPPYLVHLAERPVAELADRVPRGSGIHVLLDDRIRGLGSDILGKYTPNKGHCRLTPNGFLQRELRWGR